VHVVWPTPHLATHWPLEHTVPAPQTKPQLPQLSPSVSRFVHTPAQAVPSMPLHVVAQTPSEQLSPAGQRLPQAPQLSGSFARTAQYAVAPTPHAAYPFAHTGAHAAPEHT
jgi:hypothetical protein